MVRTKCVIIGGVGLGVGQARGGGEQTETLPRRLRNARGGAPSCTSGSLSLSSPSPSPRGRLAGGALLSRRGTLPGQRGRERSAAHQPPHNRP
jgi:hypothetical protein